VFGEMKTRRDVHAITLSELTVTRYKYKKEEEKEREREFLSDFPQVPDFLRIL